MLFLLVTPLFSSAIPVSPPSREAAAEMSRIWAGDTWEPWLEKIYFYAFPAPTLLFQPEDLEALHEHEDSTT